MTSPDVVPALVWGGTSFVRRVYRPPSHPQHGLDPQRGFYHGNRRVNHGGRQFGDAGLVLARLRPPNVVNVPAKGVFIPTQPRRRHLLEGRPPRM